MASSKVVHLSDASFDNETQNGYSLADFWAQWCKPCLMLAPVIDELAEELDGKLKVCKLNVDQNQDAANRFGIRGIPYIVLLKDGEVVGSVTGNDPGSVRSLAQQAA